MLYMQQHVSAVNIMKLSVIIDSYDIMKRNNCVIPAMPKGRFAYNDIVHGVEHVFYNKNEKIAILVNDSELPYDTEGNNMYTCVEWEDAAEYIAFTHGSNDIYG